MRQEPGQRRPSQWAHYLLFLNDRPTHPPENNGHQNAPRPEIIRSIAQRSTYHRAACERLP